MMPEINRSLEIRIVFLELLKVRRDLFIRQLSKIVEIQKGSCMILLSYNSFIISFAIKKRHHFHITHGIKIRNERFFQIFLGRRSIVSASQLDRRLIRSINFLWSHNLAL